LIGGSETYSVSSSVSSKSLFSIGLDFGYLLIKRIPEALLPRLVLSKKIRLKTLFLKLVPRPELSTKLAVKDSGSKLYVFYWVAS